MPKVSSLGRHVQAIVTGFTATNIDHLDLALTDGISTSNKTLTNAQVVANAAQTFAHLHHSTNYRISAKAYFDATQNLQISVDNASSAAINVVNNDVIAPVTIPVQLIPQLFDGTATGAFNVLTGGVTDAATPAAIL